MVIYDNGTYRKDSRYPNEKFDANAKYVIDDNSSLAQKYENYVFSGLIPRLIFGENGEIIDVIYDESIKEKEDKIAEISQLEQELAKEDYKIIKCMEAALTGCELPYDIVALKAERDKKRIAINNLQDYLGLS